MPTDLPDDPSAEQVDAWVELAELVADPAFKARVREMVVAGSQQPSEMEGYDPAPVCEHAGGALAAGITPDSAEGQEVLARIVDPDLSRERRLALADQLATFSDRRVERYWTLLSVINGWPRRPATVPAFEWVIDALRA
jgi:hypothetical protein